MMQFNWIKSIDIIENLGSVCGLISINRDWKESCDFIGNYITFILIPVNKSACLDLPNCTHFVGNADIDGGMCLLKAGYTTYNNTVSYAGESVCGVVESRCQFHQHFNILGCIFVNVACLFFLSLSQMFCLSQATSRIFQA